MARTKAAPTGDTSRFAPLTENQIKAQTDSGSFSLGRSYYRQGRIHDTVLRDGVIEALCEGSEYQPYRVQATLAPTGERIGNPRTYSCSCPRGGFCKHVVAMLLTWINDPGAFVTRPPLSDLLAGKSHDELVALIERMVQRYPELERLVELPMPVARGTAGVVAANEVTVDEVVIRRQARAALAVSDPYGYGWDDSWGHGWGAPAELHTLRGLGQSYVAAGQWANAQVVCSALAEEIIEEAGEWMCTADETGDLTGIITDCDKGLTDWHDAQAELPDRAIAICRQKAEVEIERRSRSNYQVAAKHLARVKETLERHGRRDDWKTIITELRERNKRLRALREELDNLDLT